MMLKVALTFLRYLKPVKETHAAPPPMIRVRIRANGWIRHRGGPFPFHPDSFVEAVCRDGLAFRADRAKTIPESMWDGSCASWHSAIVAYRLVREPAL